MSLPRPRRLSDEDSHLLRFSPTEKLTRAEILSELLDLWEFNITVIDVNEFKRIPGMREARVDLEKAIKVLKATYRMESLLGCDTDFIAEQIDACEKKSPETTRQHDEDVIL